MANVIGKIRQVLVQYTVTQRLAIYVLFTLICSLFLTSVNPVIWFLVTLLLSWLVVKQLYSLTCHVQERYIFRLLDIIDEVEYFVKRHVLRNAEFEKAKSISEVVSRTSQEQDEPNIDEDSFNTPESEARVCIQYIVRDFINSWYKEYISTENQPIEEAQEVLEQLTIQTFDRTKRVEVIPLVKQVIVRFQKHISDYNRAQEHWKQQPYYRSKRNREKPEFKKMEGLISAFKATGKFHPAMKDDGTEFDYLRSVMKIIMKTSFPNEAFKCDAARELLLEILTQNVLKALINLLGDPFWLHKVMVLILTDDDVEIIDTPVAETQEVPTNIDTPVVEIQDVPNVEEPVIQNASEVASGNNTSDATIADIELCSNLPNVQLPTVILDVNPNVEPEESASPVQVTNSTPDLPMDVRSHESSVEPEFKPTFFVGDFDSLSNNSVESDLMDTSQRTAPEGCSPPKEFSSHSKAYPTESFQKVSEAEKVESTELMSETEAEHNTDRKELYKVRNRKWDPENDRIMPSPLTLLSDSSTYSDSIDISKVDSVAAAHSAPDFQSLKIDYGPDISNIDPAALIKETPRILFAGVHIPNTDTAREPGGASQYTLYCIEYVAWHFLQSIGRWTQQPGDVKRRYREFITLQDRLQDHPKYRKSINDVKGPNRWRVKPLGQLHEKTVESRRRFLEQYLQVLTKKEDVGASMALKEFLAYEADTSIAFVKKAPEMPRFDKMIVRTFSGVMNKIATMPGTIQDADRPTSPMCQDSIPGSDANSALTDGDLSGCDDTDAFNIDFDLWYPEDQDEAYNNIESILWKTTYLNDSRAGHLMSECETASDTEFYDPVDFTPIGSPRPEGDGCDKDQLNTRVSPSGAEIPLTVKILDLAVQLADGQEAWVSHKNALHLFKIVIGKALDRFITHEIAELTCGPKCALYITKLRDTLWPSGELDSTVENTPSEKQRAHTRTQAKAALHGFFPAALPVIVGQEDFNHCVDVVMNCIDHPQLNRTFAFTLLDLIVEAVFPEINTASLQQQLMSISAEDNLN